MIHFSCFVFFYFVFRFLAILFFFGICGKFIGILLFLHRFWNILGVFCIGKAMPIAPLQSSSMSSIKPLDCYTGVAQPAEGHLAYFFSDITKPVGSISCKMVASTLDSYLIFIIPFLWNFRNISHILFELYFLFCFLSDSEIRFPLSFLLEPSCCSVRYNLPCHTNHMRMLLHSTHLPRFLYMCALVFSLQSHSHICRLFPEDGGWYQNRVLAPVDHQLGERKGSILG